MTWTWKDLVATLLVLAIGVPYVGYLVNGEMPFVQDPRGMSAIGIVLGLAAFLVLEGGDTRDTTDKVELGLMAVVLILGAVTFALAETAAAEVLLAVFMGGILVVWAVKVADHAGVLPLAQHPTGAP
jgi:hypothetical protein